MLKQRSFHLECVSVSASALPFFFFFFQRAINKPKLGSTSLLDESARALFMKQSLLNSIS